MKDKRQRIMIPWGYPAVYADQMFAASIMQATANPFGLPYGYGTNQMLPQVPVLTPIPHPSVMERMNNYRYSPYTMTQSVQLPKSESAFIEETNMKQENCKLFRPYALAV